MSKTSHLNSVSFGLHLVLLVMSAFMLTACASSGVKVAKPSKLNPSSVVASQELLATIPASHPQRSELRLVAMQPAPDGFSREEWLQLSMKIDISAAGKQQRISSMF